MVEYVHGVSVVLPARLRSGQAMQANWFLQAVRSLVQECSDAPLQIVLVDDGSTIDVAALAASVCEDVPNVALTVTAGPQRGLVNALNLGLSQACHPWIARLDADDIWLPGKLAAQKQFLAENPECTLCFGGMVLLDEAGAPGEAVPRGMDWMGVLGAMQAGVCPPPHGAILGRRDVFHRLGGYPNDAEAQACEDFFLWRRWARFFPMHGMDRLLLGYRRHAESESVVQANLQQVNSAAVVRDARAMGDPSEYLAALSQLSLLIGVSGAQFGGWMHDLWCFGGWIAAPRTAAAPLARVFFDRLARPSDRSGQPGFLISLF